MYADKSKSQVENRKYRKFINMKKIQREQKKLTNMTYKMKT
jgi:hypothetical protein